MYLFIFAVLFGVISLGNDGMLIGYVFLVVAFLCELYEYFFSGVIIFHHFTQGKMIDDKPERLSKLKKTTESLAQRLHMQTPDVFILANQSKTIAFVAGPTPGDSIICVRNDLFVLLNEDEFEAVVAHECAHAYRYDTLRAYIVKYLSCVALFFTAREIAALISSTFGPLFELFLFLLLPSLCLVCEDIILPAFSKLGEYAADAKAVQITRKKESLINALLKIENMGKTEGLASAFVDERPSAKDHPPLHKRVARINSIKTG